MLSKMLLSIFSFVLVIRCCCVVIVLLLLYRAMPWYTHWPIAVLRVKPAKRKEK